MDMELEVIAPQDCDNAPKRKIIRDLNIAFAKADIPALLDLFHESIIWEMMGGKTLYGIAAVTTFLHTLKEQKAKKLLLQYVLSHGKLASANGIMDFGDKQVRFADFYEFTSASAQKIKKIVSYAL